LHDWKQWYEKFGLFEPLRQFIQYNDTLLIHNMAPDRPDIAVIAGATDLNSDSDTGSESDSDHSNAAGKLREVRMAKRRLLRLRKGSVRTHPVSKMFTQKEVVECSVYTNVSVRSWSHSLQLCERSRERILSCTAYLLLI
jgi:hypothetical protein